MSKTKEALLERDEKEVQQMAEDMRMFVIEHEAGQHKDGTIPFCEKCEEEREPEPFCKDCNDTGRIEIMGDGANFEYDVVDVKPCHCQQE